MTYLKSNLHYLRLKNGLSQKELASKLYMAHQTISNHELGKSEPDLDGMQKYADFYQIPLSDLIDVDLSKKQKSFMDLGNVLIDTNRATFQILSGTKGIYAIKDVCKCQIVFEDAKYHDEEHPFPVDRRVLVTNYNFWWFNRKVYIGLEIEMKDHRKLYVYVSNDAKVQNSDSFKKYREQANQIKKKLMKYRSF